MRTGGPPILVVDDDDAILDVLGGQITLAGYEVDATNSPGDALDGLRRTRYAAIISDYRMPGMCGLDLLARARQVQPLATRILITGVLAIDTMMPSIESGLLHRFLAKPWARVELLAAVEAAVQHHWLIEENHRLKNEVRRLSGVANAIGAKGEAMFEPGSCRMRDLEGPGMLLADAVSRPTGFALLDAGDERAGTAIDVS